MTILLTLCVFPFFVAENKAQANLYNAIKDHIRVSEEIDLATERMIDCKDPASRQKRGVRIQRLENRRRRHRDAIENVLGVQDCAEDRAEAAAAAAAPQGRNSCRSQPAAGAGDDDAPSDVGSMSRNTSD